MLHCFSKADHFRASIRLGMGGQDVQLASKQDFEGVSRDACLIHDNRCLLYVLVYCNAAFYNKSV